MTRPFRVRRRSTALRSSVVVVGVFLAASVVGSGVMFGGSHPEPLGAPTDDNRSITNAQLEWNPEADDASPYPRAVRLTTGEDESFRRDDTVSITVTGQGADTCSAKAVVARDGARAMIVPFSACGVPLWELTGVAVTVSEQGGESRRIGSNAATLSAAPGPLNGDVVRPALDTVAEYTTTGHGAEASVATLRLAVRDVDAEQLVGSRLMAMTSTGQQDPSPLIGTVGTTSSNDGIWVEKDLRDTGATVVADLRALTGGHPPEVSKVAEYRLVVLQPQSLGAGQSADTRYAVATAHGTMDSSGMDAAGDVATALEPLRLDDRLQFTVIQRDEQRVPDLSFCYDFRITNTSPSAVEWHLTFDTTKPPLWGLDPTLGRFSGGIGLKDFRGGQTSSFDVDTGLWTIQGQPGNDIIPPASDEKDNHVDVGYCVQPPVPTTNRDAYTAPVFSVDQGGNAQNVELRVKVSSASQFLVPWEAEIDLAEYVCPSSLPGSISAERATLTHIEGTRYRVQGKDPDTMFVSVKHPQDFVFARYNPGGKPFGLGNCR